MRVVTWTIRLAVLLFLIALAARNTDAVTLRFFFDRVVQAPLIVLLFASFAVGALCGVLALLGTVLRQRRQIGLLRRQAASREPAPPPPAGA